MPRSLLEHFAHKTRFKLITYSKLTKKVFSGLQMLVFNTKWLVTGARPAKTLHHISLLEKWLILRSPDSTIFLESDGSCTLPGTVQKLTLSNRRETRKICTPNSVECFGTSTRPASRATRGWRLSALEKWPILGSQGLTVSLESEPLCPFRSHCPTKQDLPGSVTAFSNNTQNLI